MAKKTDDTMIVVSKATREKLMKKKDNWHNSYDKVIQKLLEEHDKKQEG